MSHKKESNSEGKTKGLKLFKTPRRNGSNGHKMRHSCGFYRAKDQLPPIVEQACTYLEHYGK